MNKARLAIRWLSKTSVASASDYRSLDHTVSKQLAGQSIGLSFVQFTLNEEPTDSANLQVC